LRLLTEPELREDLRAKGAARSKLFDWNICARETLAILERIGQGAGA
jgi:glycosyltransferase involved in cell wall biosynthesis